MSENGSEFTTGIGRIVWGHPGETRDKMKDGQKVLDPQTQQPVKQTTFGVAFPKAEFEASVLPWLQYEAASTFTQGVPPTFAWKYVDGDRTDAPWNTQRNQAGTPYNQREGYAGHYVLTFSTELPGMPQMFVQPSPGSYFQIDKSAIKCGDYVAVKVNAKAHGGQSPGLFINPMLLVKVFDGPEIRSSGGAGDPAAAFAGINFGAPPPGATAPATPMPGAPAPGMPQAPAPGAPMAAPQQPAYAPPAAPAAPAPGMVPGMPQPAAAPPAAPVAPAPAAPGTLPPPHTGIIPGAPPAAPGAPGGFPGMPQPPR